MSRKTSTGEHQDDAALYALGTLQGEEARLFERAMASDPTLTTDVEEFSAVVAELGYAAAPQQPPADLRSRVLSRVTAESTAAPVVEKDGLLFVRSAQLDWEPANVPDVQIKTLLTDPQSGYRMILVRMAPGAVLHSHRHADIEDSYVLEGDLRVSGVLMQTGDYCRAETGSTHTGISTRNGCVFLARASQQNEYFA